MAETLAVPAFRGGGQLLGSRRKGFTLAEVLITLGVIGTVAALILPGVMSNFEKQKTLSKLKKGYASVGLMYKTILNNTGCEDLECTGLLDIEETDTAHSPNLHKKWVELAGIKDVKYNFSTGHIYTNPISCGLIGKSCQGANIGTFRGYFQTPDGIGYRLVKTHSVIWRPVSGYDQINPGGLIIYIIPNPNHKDLRRPNNQKQATLGLNLFWAQITRYSNKVEPTVQLYFGAMNDFSQRSPSASQASGQPTCDPVGAPITVGWANGVGCLQRIIAEGWDMTYWGNKNAGCYVKDPAPNSTTWTPCP